MGLYKKFIGLFKKESGGKINKGIKRVPVHKKNSVVVIGFDFFKDGKYMHSTRYGRKKVLGGISDLLDRKL